MGNLTIATIFVVSLNVLMWLCQTAMLDMNPAGPTMYNIEGSVIGETVAGQNNGTVVQDDVLDDLPSSAGTVQTGESGFFTDIFNNILGWMKTAPGIKYVYGVVSAPYNVLKALGLPAEFVVGIGTLWYLVSLLVLVAFLWGRD
jgi:hypothetical protein